MRSGAVTRPHAALHIVHVCAAVNHTLIHTKPRTADVRNGDGKQPQSVASNSGAESQPSATATEEPKQRVNTGFHHKKHSQTHATQRPQSALLCTTIIKSATNTWGQKIWKNINVGHPDNFQGGFAVY